MGKQAGWRRFGIWGAVVVALAVAGAAEAANGPPVAVADRVTVRLELFTDIDVLANDSDPDGDFLTVQSVSSSDLTVLSSCNQVVESSVCILGDGILRVRYRGTKSAALQYTVSDGATTGAGSSRTATVTLEIPPGLQNILTVCVADVAATSPGQAVDIDVLANDANATRTTRVGNVLSGTALVLADQRTVRFTPASGFLGTATFTYWASNSTEVEDSATVYVTVSEDPPINEQDAFRTERDKILVLSEADLVSDDGDSGARLVGVQTTQGSLDLIEPPQGRPWVLYHPPAGQEGVFHFTYNAFNSAGNPYTGTVEVTVTPPAGNLVARDDLFRTVPGGCLDLSYEALLANDEDGTEAGPRIGGGETRSPVVGTMTEVSGRYDYRGIQGYSGTKDFFQYQATASSSASSAEKEWATVVIDIGSTPEHERPAAVADFAQVSDTAIPVYIHVLDNDIDPRCSSLKVISVSGAGKGTPTIVGGQTQIRYDAFPNLKGEDTFTYGVQRTSGGPIGLGTVTVKLPDQLKAPEVRLTYDGCEDMATCLVDGSGSRDSEWNVAWDFPSFDPDCESICWASGAYCNRSPRILGCSLDTLCSNCGTNDTKCDEHWYIEGAPGSVQAGSSPATDCSQTTEVVAKREGKQSLSGWGLSTPALVPVELTLWSLVDPTAVSSQRIQVPYGATTDEWTVDVSCLENTCAFHPVGSWVDGVVTRFWWYFGPIRKHNPCAPFGCGQIPVDPDLETLDLSPVTHAFVGAQPGETEEANLVVFLFDRYQPFEIPVPVTIPISPPAAPVGIRTENQNCAATGPVVLWGDASNNEDGFRVYRSVQGGTFRLLEGGELEANETSLQDHYDGPRTHELRYRVVAFNAGGESEAVEASGFPAPADCGSPGALPIAPSHMEAGPPSSGVHLSWRDNTSQESGYRLLRSTDGANFELLAVLVTNSTHYYNAPLTPGATYFYRVQAFNELGQSAAANVTVHVPLGSFLDSFETGDSSAWDITVGSRRLFFDSFETANTSLWDLTIRDGTLFFDGFESADGSAWDVAVRMNGLFRDGFETANTSGWDTVVGLFTPTAQAPAAEPQSLRVGSFERESAAMRPSSKDHWDHLLRPSDLRVLAFEGGGVRLGWRDRSSTETAFRIYRKAKQGPWQLLASLPPDVESYLDEGPLVVGERYRYRVAAVGIPGNGQGDSQGGGSGQGGGPEVERKSPILRVEVPADLFRDSFERADLAFWDGELDLDDRLAPSFGSALFGNRGLHLRLGEGVDASLETHAPAAERQLRARLFLDAGGLRPAQGTPPGSPLFQLLQAVAEDGVQEVFAVVLVKDGDGVGLRALAVDDGGDDTATPVLPLAPGVHRVEVLWQAEGASGGLVELAVDDEAAVQSSGFAAATRRVGRLRLGALAPAPGLEGYVHVDEVALSRGSEPLGLEGVAGELDSQSFEFSAVPNWQLNVVGSAQLRTAAADLEGEQALALTVSGPDQQAFLERHLNRSTDHLLLQLLVDAGGLSLSQGAEVGLVSALSRATDRVLLHLVLRRQGQTTYLVARALDGEGSREISLALPKRPSQVEVEWRGSAPEAGDGTLVLRVLDLKAETGATETLSGLATAGDLAGILRLGVAAPTGEGVTGTLLLDAFRAWR